MASGPKYLVLSILSGLLLTAVNVKPANADPPPWAGAGIIPSNIGTGTTTRMTMTTMATMMMGIEPIVTATTAAGTTTDTTAVPAATSLAASTMIA